MSAGAGMFLGKKKVPDRFQISRTALLVGLSKGADLRQPWRKHLTTACPHHSLSPPQLSHGEGGDISSPLD